ncbi:MAG: hypothetical protein LC750_03245 [Actinobacteria bacterium]|nr:hypothetical protein [Actinomycetota bacterium]
MPASVVEGRAAFERRDWQDAYAELSAADTAMLELDDLERLATAAYLVGRSSESADCWERAHHQWIGHGDNARAARCAFWLRPRSLSRIHGAIR